MKSHEGISLGNIMNGNIMKSLKAHKARNLMRKPHTINVQHEAEKAKEAEFIHSRRKKKRRKNSHPNTVAGNEDSLKLHAQPTTLAPSQQIS